jgi:hypothetical protein
MPSRPTALAGPSQATVSWDALYDDGGAAITGYEVQVEPTGAPCSTTDTTCVLTHLTDGIGHRFAVRAINTYGPGPWSPWSYQITPTTCVADHGPFTDVAGSSTFCTEIEQIAAWGLVNGFSDGSYHPSSGLSRQAIVAILYRLAGEPTVVAAGQSFTDVPPHHPFYDEIEWAQQRGVVHGYGDGTFRPTAPLTRQACAAVLHRFAGQEALAPTTPSFDDVPPSHPFYGQIEWLHAQDVLNGYADGTFRPGSGMSRQAFAAIMWRYVWGGAPWDGWGWPPGPLWEPL